MRLRISGCAVNNVPGLADVDDIDTVGAGLPEVGLHVNLEVLRAEMALGGQEHLDVLRRRVHSSGQIRRRHLEY